MSAPIGPKQSGNITHSEVKTHSSSTKTKTSAKTTTVSRSTLKSSKKEVSKSLASSSKSSSVKTKTSSDKIAKVTRSVLTSSSEELPLNKKSSKKDSSNPEAAPSLGTKYPKMLKSSQEHVVPEIDLSFEDELATSSESGQDSSEELSLCDTLPVFSRDGKYKANTTTVICKKIKGQVKNLKGGTLLQIVHEVVQNKRTELVTAAYTDHFGLNPEGYITYPSSPTDWVRFLGHWKSTMITDSEITGTTPKFKGVQCDSDFFIIDNIDRLHLPQRILYIGPNNFTNASRGQTDLSYAHILEGINCVTHYAKKTEKELASLQLDLICCKSDIKFELSLEEIKKHESFLVFREFEKLRENIFLFFKYLNCLMFGIEASGLNASLLTSIMTLKLIANGTLTYKQAFNQNDDGGLYPYANKGGQKNLNRGTYVNRKHIVKSIIPEQSDSESSELSASEELNRQISLGSMKRYRKEPSYSPPALKEVMIIKLWLEEMGVTNSQRSYKDQKKAVQEAIDNLMKKYFDPAV